MSLFHYKEEFLLESGGSLTDLTLNYQTWGTLNASRDNVIWICHALTASADAENWWPGMIGRGLAFDPDQYFIVCVNMPGSCYGSTGPLSIDTKTGHAYYYNFPLITIRDMVKAYQLLANHLAIERIELLAGGSMGGYQAMEWCLMQPSLISSLFLIATAAKENAWRIAIHTAQRMAIEADNSWGLPDVNAGSKGLAAARAIGMLTYRNAAIFNEKQSDDEDKLDDYKVSSYMQYQGKKLTKRFNAYSYWYLTKAMDSHNLSRTRNQSLAEVLGSISQPTLVMGVKSDILCPPEDQAFLATHIPNAQLELIDSIYGHDGFLTETQVISQIVKHWIFNLKYDSN